MRPRHVCRGMQAREARRQAPGSRFNEAPACLPGNAPGIDAGEPATPRFNEAPACLPGNGPSARG